MTVQIMNQRIYNLMEWVLIEFLLNASVLTYGIVPMRVKVKNDHPSIDYKIQQKI